ncbi:MAG: hypothetical protein ACE5GB_06915, partial [Acidimicrobiales bacterium]
VDLTDDTARAEAVPASVDLTDDSARAEADRIDLRSRDSASDDEAPEPDTPDQVVDSEQPTVASGTDEPHDGDEDEESDLDEPAPTSRTASWISRLTDVLGD